MTHDVSTVSFGEYIGRAEHPAASDLGILPAQMPDGEFNFLLGSTNRELKCLILGLIPPLPQSRSVPDIKQELIDRGAGDLEKTLRSTIVETLGRFSMALMVHDGQDVSLTPYGQVVRAIGGHQLHDISPLAPLANVYGTARRRTVEHNNVYLSHMRRVLLIRTLAETRNASISQVALSTHMEQLGIPQDIIKHDIRSLRAVKLIDIEKDESFGSRGRSYIKPRPVIKDLGKQLLTFTENTVSRNSSYAAEGEEKLQAILDNRKTLPYIVRRSVHASGKPKSTLEQLSSLVENIIEDRGRPLTSNEIFAALPEEIKNNYAHIKSFRIVLSRTISLGNTRLSTTKSGKEVFWGTKVRRGY